MKLKIDSTILNHKAVQKFTMEKPSTNQEAILIDRALITNVNKPKVKMLIGKVRINNTGFKLILIKPKTKATKIATQKFLIPRQVKDRWLK
jgi:hypothetical protein